MAGNIQIRTVRVELLRAGPAHNQLLSPLTPYLGVCDDSEAGVVNVPFEQHTFERRMRAMRHESLSDDEGLRPPRKDHLPDLRDLGVAMAKLLGSVPRLPGALTGDPNGRDTVLRLSLTLSASELAGLPFELAKVPIGPDAYSENWLSLQSRVPVVITRRTRNVSVPNVRLRWLASPHILFVAAGGPGSTEIPFDEHLAALQAAVKPFSDRHNCGDPTLRGTGAASAKDLRLTYGDMLTVLCHASLDGLMRECARVPYTHIHILAHGEQDDSVGDRSHGVALHPDDGVISGERLASALAGVVRGRLHRPQVVTLATCDSGNPGNVVHPGASLAHVLHQSGIPLVVASQVPLTFEASTLFTRIFYGGLLWGEHPWVLMHRVRAILHGRQKPEDHDWASLVVYESLPSDIDEALEEATFRQCERALQVVMARIGGNVEEGSKLDRTICSLIEHGRTYAMEACALRAEVLMLRAWHAAAEADHEKDKRSAGHSWQRSLWYMEQALTDYERAVDGFLINPGQGLNAPYRALLAHLSIQVAALQPFDLSLWAMARYWAERIERQAPSVAEKVSALGSQALLSLLRMAGPAGSGQETPEYLAFKAEHFLREMVQAQKSGTASETLLWTRMQLENLAAWWTHPEFAKVVLRVRGDHTAGPRSLPLELGPEATRLRKLLDDLTAYAGRGESVDDEVVFDDPVAASGSAAQPPAASVLAASTGAAAAATSMLSKPPAKPKKPAAGTFLDIEMLPVAQGDCLWIEWGDAQQRFRMLVDCGTESSFNDALGPRIAQLPEDPARRRFELFILSHIDGDHIGGGIPLLQQAKRLGLSFGDIWFNGREHLVRKNMLSAKDGDDFTTLLKREQLPWNLFTQHKSVVRRVDATGREAALPSITLAGGLKLTLLSPVPATLEQLAGEWDKELAKPSSRRRVLAGRNFELREDLDQIVGNPFKPDKSKPNGSSIAVLLEYAGKTVLLGADAYADVLASALKKLLPAGQKRLKLDAFKVSHHGSRGNVHDELLALIDCEHYLISTSGAGHSHPDREALARLVRRSVRPATLWFNHPVPQEDREYHMFWQRLDIQQKWGFSTRVPEQPGQTFSLRWAAAKPSA